MALVRWRDPVDMMPAFPSFIDSFFQRDFPGFSSEFSSTIPSVNVKEDKENFTLEVAAPGMSKENFDVKLENNVLMISGKKEETKEDKDEKYNRREFYYSSFERSFSLPESVDAEHIQAVYKDGILKVSVPKTEKSKEKEVKTISIS